MTAPLCKDCAHFLPSLYEHEDNSDYWLQVKLINSGCGIKKLPDPIYGTDGVPSQMERGIPYRTAYAMRTSGPCGMAGKFFEPKGEKSK